ncbi:MAG: YqgE/AlgH family protein [Alphaproteobacteria bacterium]|nr:YqgE/AlgH family protein [Alphaproteobacteria bacterium]
MIDEPEDDENQSFHVENTSIKLIRGEGDGWLTGQLLVAMPNMIDPNFTKTVIYVCSHSPNGAMGIVVNRLYGQADFDMLLDQLNITTSLNTPDLDIHYGGPVEQGRGFVLHSTDFVREGTVQIDDDYALSATVEILQAIADGDGPSRLVLALGYSGWGAGQLESEIKANGWLVAPADDALLFGEDIDTKWERALAKIGITPLLLSGDVGHA